MYKTGQPIVVIPNLNGGEELLAAVQSLVKQSLAPYIIIVDNASTDGSAEHVKAKFPDIELIRNAINAGYAGGVNPGFKRAIELNAPYVAPFNDDAVADKRWLKQLVEYLDANPRIGVAACKVIAGDKERLDSTGEYYTVWGLAYPRGRREYDLNRYDQDRTIFAASGAASLYRVKSLKSVGLLDEDFFAYYEDVDLSFRLQLAGWKVAFVPTSVVYHHIGMTGGRIKGFYTYQTMKNLPLIWFKNVPRQYLWTVGWRLLFAQMMFFGRATTRGQFWPALKGTLAATYLVIRKIPERYSIQKNKKVANSYIWNMIVHDLPPNASALRNLRARWWRLKGKKVHE
ncbi:MAG TPA: glycosyltransferase family 2 protein [Candidatus Saccharimonadia bacterium]|nr:glycosyltransferase family 2 protein [Candidatus Saccharimonadia bacterium]